MTVPYEVDEISIDAYVGADLRVAEMPSLAVPLGSIEAEATQVTFGLAVLKDEHLIAERQLLLEIRVRFDDIVHLWHYGHDAISAAITIDPRAKQLRLNLTFTPAGHSAARVVQAAEFLQLASTEDTRLALRLPDGTLAPERVSIPPELKVDDKLIRLLRLIADVGRLANVDIPVPDDIDEENVRDLFTAQQLLSGQPVRRRWSAAEITLESAALGPLQEALEKASRHEFLRVAQMAIQISGLVIPLGEIQEQFSDAVVEDLSVTDSEVVLRLRAYDETASVEMRPQLLAPPPIEAHVTVPESVFNDLLDDLDTPSRPSKLRELM